MLNRLITLLIITFSFTFAASAKEIGKEELQRLADNWNYLYPKDAYDFMPEVVDYKTLIDPKFQEKLAAAGKKINNSLNGKIIELAGFMVPIEINKSSVSKFLLVPEAGQCIHIPPPPLNQTLLVDTSNEPTALREIYTLITVSGKVSVISQSLDISASSVSDVNSDANVSQSYNNVESGYLLTDVKIDVLKFKSQKDEF